MRLKLKPSFFIALLLGLLFWFSIISFVSGKAASVDITEIYSQSTAFLSKHWITISFVISELASLLPGPWNGIIQSIIRAISKEARRNKVNH